MTIVRPKKKAEAPTPPAPLPFDISDSDRVDYFCKAFKTSREAVDAILRADESWAGPKRIDALMQRIRSGAHARASGYYNGDPYDGNAAERELRELLNRP